MRWYHILLLLLLFWSSIQFFILLQSQRRNNLFESSSSSSTTIIPTPPSPLPPFIIITMNRTNGFELLNQQLQSFEQEYAQFIPLEIHLMNVGHYILTTSELFNFTSQLHVTIHNLQFFDYQFVKQMSSQLQPKRQKQIQDFVKVIYYLQQVMLPTLQYDYFFLMEDDFSACSHSLYHLLTIVTQLPKLNQFDVIRTSYGNNGLLIRKEHVHNLMDFFNGYPIDLPIDSLLENYWINIRKLIYIYKYQLFDHLGNHHSTVDNTHMIETNYPQCLEPQTSNRMIYEWNQKECHGQLFCNQFRTYLQLNFENREESSRHFVLEKPSSSQLSIVYLQQQVKVVTSEKGMDCNFTCHQIAKQCNVNVFDLINHCHVLQYYFTCSLCGYAFVYAPGTAPHFDGTQCSLGERIHRFDCYAKQEHIQRLCICD